MKADLIRAKFREASLATKGDYADIEFSYDDLTDANFAKASLNTEGYGADIEFAEADLIRAAKFGEASLATKRRVPTSASATSDLTDANFAEGLARDGGR